MSTKECPVCLKSFKEEVFFKHLLEEKEIFDEELMKFNRVLGDELKRVRSINNTNLR